MHYSARHYWYIQNDFTFIIEYNFKRKKMFYIFKNNKEVTDCFVFEIFDIKLQGDTNFFLIFQTSLFLTFAYKRL